MSIGLDTLPPVYSPYFQTTPEILFKQPIQGQLMVLYYPNRPRSMRLQLLGWLYTGPCPAYLDRTIHTQINHWRSQLPLSDTFSPGAPFLILHISRGYILYIRYITKSPTNKKRNKIQKRKKSTSESRFRRSDPVSSSTCWWTASLKAFATRVIFSYLWVCLCVCLKA